MNSTRKTRICALLKAIETGDPAGIAVVDEDRYIQHNPQTHEGGEGLAALFKRLAKTSPHVNIVRVFADGDYVFAHTEYDFSTRRIGFEVFRFEDERAVEHWDNIQPRRGPNRSGHSMVDGPCAASDLDRTEANRSLVRQFVKTVLIARDLEGLTESIDGEQFTQHDPGLEDGIDALKTQLEAVSDGRPVVDYQRLHRVLAEGSFVLSVSEGYLEGVHTSFYDLFRVADGKIAEHWDTIEHVPAQSQWKNDNGKF